MQRRVFTQRFFSVPDLAILCLVSTTIYGIVAIGNEWGADFHPITQIDLSIKALPYYTILSGIRGVVAYFISLGFTLIIGYTAAKSKSAEKIIIPMLDIFQSIPVLGFLPGLLLGLVALFPHSNIGLELAAILMIFTGQVWNMTFAFYSSLKSIPNDLKEASTVMGLSWQQKLKQMELPFSAVNLAWNSLLSMAGGWFFLIPCEAINLGDKEYRLPGIGAYMDVAIKQGNHQAVVAAIVAMVLLIVIMDFVIWRPILAWVQKFRLEDVSGVALEEPLMRIWLRESKILRWLKLTYRNYQLHRKFRIQNSNNTVFKAQAAMIRENTARIHGLFIEMKGTLRLIEGLLAVCIIGAVAFGAYKLLTVLILLPPASWVTLIRDTFWTFLRVIFAVVASTLWAVPVGIWIGTSPKRTRVAQPLIQVMASFPAPMLYPLVLSVLLGLRMSFDWASMFLIFLGVQWYVLFNVLAGAMRIPQELNDALSLMKASHWDRWKKLYLPSVFPSLVTGWVSAAGGAWNASVVAEYLFYEGTILKTAGLGATLNVATASANFTLFAASLTLMVLFVVILNRFVWSRVYVLAQTRFKMEV